MKGGGRRSRLGARAGELARQQQRLPDSVHRKGAEGSFASPVSFVVGDLVLGPGPGAGAGAALEHGDVRSLLDGQAERSIRSLASATSPFSRRSRPCSAAGLQRPAEILAIASRTGSVRSKPTE